MKITFMGAAGCVTGSCTLIETGNARMLVDCGMRQGSDEKDAPEGQFIFDPKSIDAMVLTHAHIDHSGMIPLLVKKGFKGRIFSTGATTKLCSIMLPDAGHIQEMEVEWENRKRRRAGKPEIDALYTAEDAMKSMKYFSEVDYESDVKILEGINARFIDAGHLLGSASVILRIEENGKTKELVFSGDIGNKDKPIIKDPTYIKDNANIVFMESTYGDRLHQDEDKDTFSQFKKVLSRSIAAGGNIIIPSFAVGRTQELLYDISVMLDEKSVPGLERIPVYIDSPLGIAATQIFEESSKGYYDEEAMEYKSEGVEFFSFETLKIAQTVEESKAINFDNRQKIIISSSGMCEAGRIKHHLKHNLWCENCTVLFVGYQAIGTLGRAILDGKKNVKIFGEEIQVKATIEHIEGFSAHADKAGLMEWISNIPDGIEKLFVMHGEEEVSKKFAAELRELGYNAVVPEMFAEYDTDTFEKVVAKVTRHKAEMPDSGAQELVARMKKALEGGGSEKAEAMRKELSELMEKWEKELSA